MPVRFAIFTICVITLLLFQNCGKAPASTATVTDTVAIEKVFEGPKLESKTFFISYDPAVVADAESLIEKGLKLDVESGVISYMARSNSPDGLLKVGDRFCLTSAERDELSQLVSQDSVCRGLNPMKPEDYCAMAMQLPYALYGSDSQALTEVGSARCLKAPDIDFCSGQGERVADLLDQVVRTLDQRSCQ